MNRNLQWQTFPVFFKFFFNIKLGQISKMALRKVFVKTNVISKDDQIVNNNHFQEAKRDRSLIWIISW